MCTYALCYVAMRRESGRDAKGDVKLETRRDERIDAEKKERERKERTARING